MSSSKSKEKNAAKRNEEKNTAIVRELGHLPHNNFCFECNQRGPTCVNMTIGAFVCLHCSGLLRGLVDPPHRLKSISMATFSNDEVEFLKKRGNDYCRKVWLHSYDPRIHSRPQDRDPQRLKDHLTLKYDEKTWYSKQQESELADQLQNLTLESKRPSKSSISFSSRKDHGGATKATPRPNAVETEAHHAAASAKQTKPKPVSNNLDPWASLSASTVPPAPVATNSVPSDANWASFPSNTNATKPRAPSGSSQTLSFTDDPFSNALRSNRPPTHSNVEKKSSDPFALITSDVPKTNSTRPNDLSGFGSVPISDPFIAERRKSVASASDPFAPTPVSNSASMDLFSSSNKDILAPVRATNGNVAMPNPVVTTSAPPADRYAALADLDFTQKKVESSVAPAAQFSRPVPTSGGYNVQNQAQQAFPTSSTWMHSSGNISATQQAQQLPTGQFIPNAFDPNMQFNPMLAGGYQAQQIAPPQQQQQTNMFPNQNFSTNQAAYPQQFNNAYPNWPAQNGFSNTPAAAAGQNFMPQNAIPQQQNAFLMNKFQAQVPVTNNVFSNIDPFNTSFTSAKSAANVNYASNQQGFGNAQMASTNPFL